VVLVLGFSRTNLSLIGSGLLSFLSYGFLSGHDHGFVELLLLSGWSYLSWYGVKLPWWLLDILFYVISLCAGFLIWPSLYIVTFMPGCFCSGYFGCSWPVLL
jgi:hypothetical protein